MGLVFRAHWLRETVNGSARFVSTHQMGVLSITGQTAGYIGSALLRLWLRGYAPVAGEPGGVRGGFPANAAPAAAAATTPASTPAPAKILRVLIWPSKTCVFSATAVQPAASYEPRISTLPAP